MPKLKFRIIKETRVSGDVVYYLERKGWFFWHRIQDHGYASSEDFMTDDLDVVFGRIKTIRAREEKNTTASSEVIKEIN